MAGQGLERTGKLPDSPAVSSGFAVRKRSPRRGDQTWRQTVTHYMPEPWLVALAHERMGLPVKPGHRPEANR